MELNVNADGFPRVIELLKGGVSKMLLERAGPDSVSSPTEIWSEVLKVFGYLLNLAPEDFRSIRYHTMLINGINIFQYWHPWPQPDPAVEAKRIGYISATEGVPEHYWTDEPDIPAFPRPLGVSFRGRIVNQNIVRYQRCVSSLYFAGAWDAISNATSKSVVMEVGGGYGGYGGYGGLAYSITKALSKKIVYVIIDFPEMLLFQGAFLAQNLPDARIYLYDEKSCDPNFVKEGLLEYDIALIPVDAFAKLYELEEVAVFINMQSFQEMSENQIDDYLVFAHKKVSVAVYSDNMECHPYNDTLPVPVSALLKDQFELVPAPDYYAKLFSERNVVNPYGRYCRFVGFPKGRPIPPYLAKKMMM